MVMLIWNIWNEILNLPKIFPYFEMKDVKGYLGFKISTFSASAVFGVNAPISQSLTYRITHWVKYENEVKCRFETTIIVKYP